MDNELNVTRESVKNLSVLADNMISFRNTLINGGFNPNDATSCAQSLMHSVLHAEGIKMQELILYRFGKNK